MDQQCLECKEKFRLGRLMGTSNYPFAATAAFCPFCGDNLEEQEEPEVPAELEFEYDNELDAKL